MTKKCAALLVLAIVCVHVAQAEPVTSLHRKAGLWSLTVSVDGKQGLGAQGPGVMRQCIDANTDARMMQMASQSDAHHCSKNELIKDGRDSVLMTLSRY